MFHFRQNAAKSLGFQHDQEGILNRYLRENKNWDIHLQHSKDFILKSLTTVEYSSIAILGSGWLLDVPIDALIQLNKKVYLVDIFHPQQIKYKYRNFSNIVFVQADITAGLINSVHEIIKKGIKPSLSEIVISHYNLSEKVDFVVSLNLLNQLDILLVDNLTENFNFETRELEQFRKRIQQNHFDFLRQYNFSILFDYKEICFNKDNEKVSENNSIFIDLPTAPIEETWQWIFDTCGSYNDSEKVIFEVMAKTYLK